MLKFEQVQNYKHSIKYCYAGKISGFYVAQIIYKHVVSNSGKKFYLMKKRVYGILILALLVIFVLRWNLPITNSKVVGIYVITDFDKQNSKAETPIFSDTLILNTDNTFSSGFYGIGMYKLKRKILTTEIYLSYDYEMGKANLKAYFSNKIYEKPKIILNSDLKKYYEKLN